ncbi:hypothetical protein ACFC26_09740 [Kitasatospora purpeofusca]|uniref:hypothetical protein n=1 Tax=Kitasatospora purpeofusca TaxID=67352 RepID=UPI0035DB3048
MRRQDHFPPRPSDVGRTLSAVQRELRERAANLMPRLRRADGTTAATLGTSWAWLDGLGNPVVAEDSITGGLARPYLQLGFAPARYTDWLATTSGVFEDIHRSTFGRMQPYAYVSIGHTTDDPSTTGQVQLTVNGTAVGTPTSVVWGISAVTVGPFPLPGAVTAQVELRVRARRTAGTGNVRCAVLAASGIES